MRVAWFLFVLCVGSLVVVLVYVGFIVVTWYWVCLIYVLLVFSFFVRHMRGKYRNLLQNGFWRWIFLKKEVQESFRII